MSEDLQKEPFDLRVHIVDPKSKRIIKVQNYLRHADKERGLVYERDGKFFHENGTEIPAEKVWVKPTTGPSVEAKPKINPTKTA